MKSLATDDFLEKVLKSLWLDKMSDLIKKKNILSICEDYLDKLAIMADKISDMKSQKEIYTVSPNINSNDALLSRIAALEQKIDSLQIHDHSRSKFRYHH